MKKSIVKVYLNKEEKERLQMLSNEKNISVSQLVKEACEPLLQSEYIPSFKMDNTSSDISRKRRYPIYLTDSEYTQLFEEAKKHNWTIAKVIREKLYDNSEGITITYEDDDIRELIVMITDTYLHLIGTADNLKERNLILPSDYERLKSYAYELKASLESCSKYTYRNRDAIRRTAIRHLDAQIQKAVQEKYKDRRI